MEEQIVLNDFLAKSTSKILNSSIKSKFGVNPNVRIQSLLINAPSDIDRIIVTCVMTVDKDGFDKLIEEVTK